MATESEIGLATCKACYTCEGVASGYDDATGVEAPTMVFSDVGFWDYPDLGLWKGEVSETCACFEEFETPVLGDFYPFDPIALDECDEVLMSLAEDDDINVFSDILPWSDAGYLAFPWYFDNTPMTLGEAEELIGNVGKVGIYYYTIDVDGAAFDLYHALYNHGAPGITRGGTSIESERTTTALYVALDPLEVAGLTAKYGALDCDCADDLDLALTDTIDGLIAEIASLIVESQYTFKKIKQPTVDVRLFSAFGKSQKEETQTVSVVAGSTTTTYDTY